MKNKKLIMVGIGVFLFVLGIFVFLLLKPKKDNRPLILFYSLNESETVIMKNAITDYFFDKIIKETKEDVVDKENLLPFKFKDLQNTSLSNFLSENKNVLFVISENSFDFFEANKFFKIFTNEEFSSLPSTFQKSLFTEKYTAYPFLLNTYALCYSKEIFKTNNLTPPVNLEEFEKVLLACKDSVNYPLVCNGSDDETLLYLITVLMNSNGKIENTKEFDEFIKNPEVNKSIPENLKTALDILVDWRKKGLLHPEWFRLVEKDVEIFMDFKNTAVSFMNLSQYRKLRREVFSNFLNSSVPTPKKLKYKNLPAKCIMVAQINTNEKNKNDFSKLKEEFISLYTSNEGQSFISSKTGLAPTNASAKVGDIQASDSRYWAASSNMVIPEFSKILGGLEKEERENLIKTIRLYIEVNGVGF